MKKINHLNMTWKQVDEALHDLKGALTIMNVARKQESIAMRKIGKAIDVIYGAINEIKK